MILVVFALPQEASVFRHWLAVENRRIHEKIEIALVGVREQAVRENISAVLQRYPPRLIICGGFSGALNDELSAKTEFSGIESNDGFFV